MYQLSNTQVETFASAACGHYRLLTAWPDGPAPEQGWPVMYLLDGERYFATAVSQLAAMREPRCGMMPGVMVAIDYDGPTRRDRDYRPAVGQLIPESDPAGGLAPQASRGMPPAFAVFYWKNSSRSSSSVTTSTASVRRCSATPTAGCSPWISCLNSRTAFNIFMPPARRCGGTAATCPGRPKRLSRVWMCDRCIRRCVWRCRSANTSNRWKRGSGGCLKRGNAGCASTVVSDVWWMVFGNWRRNCA